MPADTQENIILELENIGCLKRLHIEFKLGLNIIKAPNASGKTTIIKGFSCMFSDRIPPSHILALDELNGRIRVYYRERIYEKTLRRTPSGQVIAHGEMLPFADPRAFDACVALAETGIVHRITGGSAIFRRYLEELSYGNYYSIIINATQELINEYSRKLAGPRFRNFEALPLLLTELTDLHIRRDQIQRKIKESQTLYDVKLQDLRSQIDKQSISLSKEETRLSQLFKDISSEKEREKQLQELLKLTNGSSQIADTIKKGIESSRERQERIRVEIKTQTQLVKTLKEKVEALKSSLKREEEAGPQELRNLKKKLEDINKRIILKEEEIQRAERFPPDDLEYPGRLVVDVRSEVLRKIE